MSNRHGARRKRGNKATAEEQGSKQPDTKAMCPCCMDHQPKPDGTGEHGIRDQKHWLEYLTTAFALAATIASGAAAYFGGKQASVASDTEQRQLRAYVAVSDFKVNCCEVDIERGIYRESKKFSVLTVRNGGQTPASAVVLFVGSAEYPHGLPFPTQINYRTVGTAGKIEATAEGVPVIRPASFYMLQGETKQFQSIISPMQMLRTSSSLSNTILFGEIHYRDVFGTQQIVEFCRVWETSSEAGHNYLDCPEHNGARN